MTGRGAPCSRPAVTAAQLGGPHWVLGPVLFLPLPRAPPKDTRASGTCVRDPSWVTCRVPRTRRSTRGSGRPPAPEVVSRDLLMPTLTARALVTGPRGSPPRGRGTGTCGQVRPGPRELLVCAQVAPAGSAQTPLHPAAHLLRGPRGPPGDRSPPATPLGLGSGQRTPRPLPSDPVPSPRIPRGPSLEAGQRQRAVSKQEVRADGARRGPEVLQPKRRQGAQGHHEDRAPERHLPAGQDRPPSRPAGHLPEGQQHPQHLHLPRGREGDGGLVQRAASCPLPLPAGGLPGRQRRRPGAEADQELPEGRLHGEDRAQADGRLPEALVHPGRQEAHVLQRPAGRLRPRGGLHRQPGERLHGAGQAPPVHPGPPLAARHHHRHAGAPLPAGLRDGGGAARVAGHLPAGGGQAHAAPGVRSGSPLQAQALARGGPEARGICTARDAAGRGARGRSGWPPAPRAAVWTWPLGLFFSGTALWASLAQPDL